MDGRPGDDIDPDGPLSRVGFDDPAVLGLVEQTMSSGRRERLDELGFGVIAMDRRGVVEFYNANESARSGLTPSRVVGRNFFEDVGPCTNNFMVAEVFHSASPGREALDEVIDFVFTFVMRPTPVRLRILAAPGSPHQYLLVRDR